MITTASFYADVLGKPSRFDEYLSYAKAGRLALELTNPGARYLILTDEATRPKWEAAGFDLGFVASDSSMPLMLKVIAAQLAFVRDGWDRCGLLVLPDIDCFSNRKLDDVTSASFGLAITHKGSKYNYRINNLAYVRDADLAAWFLSRAADILKTWPREQWDWWGDQDAWGAALGTPIYNVGAWVVVREYDRELLLAEPVRGKRIWLYPCASHNCPMANRGGITNTQRESYFVHFKGDRKEHVDSWFQERFGQGIGQ